MIRVEISDAADADLVDILAYGSAMFGVEQAEAYLRGFNASFDLIAEHPAIGAVHDVVRPPIRSLPHGSHRIFYDILPSISSCSAFCTRAWTLSATFSLPSQRANSIRSHRLP